MTHLEYINQNYPARKSNSEKEKFQEYIFDYAKNKIVQVIIEKTKDGKNNNIVIGDPTTAKAVLTAHYDTPAQSIFPNIMIPKNRILFYAYQFVPIVFLLVVSFAFAYLMGNIIAHDAVVYYFSFLFAYYGLFFGIMRGFKNQNNYNDNTSGVATILSIIDGLSKESINDVAFILFDNEEKGKKGSAAYFKDHSEEMNERFLLNFDCVGNGENIIFIAQKGAIDSQEFKNLQASFEKNDDFILDFCTHKEAQSNSDHKNFPCGVACIACKKSKSGILYTPYIHTNKDVVAKNSNIDYIAKNIVSFIDNI